jgi:hypothetical protein
MIRIAIGVVVGIVLGLLLGYVWMVWYFSKHRP